MRKSRMNIDAPGRPAAAPREVAEKLGLTSAAYVRVMVGRAKGAGLVTGGRSWTLTPRAHALLAESDKTPHGKSERRKRK